MDDAVELRDLGRQLRRRWWAPVLLAVVGVVVGVLVAGRMAPVYRAQGTLLVGPLSGSVTLSTTLRASESLAAFYADLARRQVVLEPVVKSLQLQTSWEELREQVSAVIPDQNPRVITLTVADASRSQARQIAREIVQRLLDLNPGPSGQNSSVFVARQVANLQADIDYAESEIAQMDATLAEGLGPIKRKELLSSRAERQRLVDQWRNTYVELMSLDPTTDAGGLQVLDEVRWVTSLDRAGAARQGALGGLVGLVLGLLAAWFIAGTRGRRRFGASARKGHDGEPTERVLPAAARVKTVLPGVARVARSPGHDA
jgi:succinoglycan biosynthesis transport protein ExoP